MSVRNPVLFVSMMIVGCRHPEPGIAEHPDTGAALGQARCGVIKSADKPLVIEWPAAERAELEARAGRGVVAVRYEGCEMEVLSQCSVPGSYAYVGLNTKHETVRIRSADELYARLPLGAAALEAQLERSGQLAIDLTVVGRQEADALEVSRLDLQGNCDRATHFVAGLTVGAFSVHTGEALGGGAGVEVAGAGVGGQRSSAREVLRDDGDPAACVAASAADQLPPQGCGALLRVEVVPLSEHAVARVPAAPQPTDPEPPAVAEPEPAEPEPAEPEPAEPAPVEPEPAVTPQPEVADRPATACDALDFEVVKIARKPPDPPFSKRSMDRVSLRITNRGSEAMELWGGSDATFLDQERGLLPADVHDEWWMPRRLPAGSSVVVRILLPRGKGKALRTIEAKAEVEGRPFSRCTVVDDRLEPTAEP